MLKKGDVVCLSDLGLSEAGLGNSEYIPNLCTEKLLAGVPFRVHAVVPVFEGSRARSVLLEGGAYSISPDYLKLVLRD